MEIDGKFYAYGFSARCIFERESSSNPRLDETVSLSKEDRVRFDTYAADFEDNIVDLFLAEMNRGKKFAATSNLQIFKNIYHWLRNHIVIITPNSRTTNFKYYYENDSLAVINNLISTFDTGVSNIRIEEIDMNDLSKMLPKPVFDDVMEHVRNNLSDTGNTSFRMSGRSDTCFFNIETNGVDKPKITTLKLRHGKSVYDFDFEDESSIMDQELFRRDEIWFIKRNEENNSQIYSLDRFKERYDKKLSKAYLEGRYGAIPVFNHFDFGKEV